jgi:UDP:flavonoid glycosyltransferase YjiC (YdhE family)
VAFATSEDLINRVRAAGFVAFQTGLPFHAHERTLTSAMAEYARMPPAQGRAFIFPRVNAVRARTNVDDLLAVAQRWQPDLIVHESAEFAAPLVAAIIGIPNVNHAYGPRVPMSILEDCGHRLADLWHGFGATCPPFGGLYRHLHIDIAPPDLQVEALTPPCPVLTIQPAGFDAVHGEEPPRWLTDLPERVTIYVTLGTRLNQPHLLRLVVESLVELDVNVICTTGADHGVAASLPRSERVHVDAYIPQSSVLPRCDLVVCHAGSGTMLGALSHGLPMLLVPHSADQFDNAELCVNNGVALRLLPDEIDRSTVRGAVRKLLDRPYARAAAGIRDELHALSTPETAVEACETLVPCQT